MSSLTAKDNIYLADGINERDNALKEANIQINQPISNGVSLGVHCRSCAQDNIIARNFYKGTYTRLLRNISCPNSKCNKKINIQDIDNLYFKNCEFIFQGIIKETDEEFCENNTHTELGSPYGYLDINDFLVYSELEVKELDLNTFNLDSPKEKTIDIVNKIISMGDNTTNASIEINSKVYDELINLKDLISLQIKTSEQDVKKLNSKYENISIKKVAIEKSNITTKKEIESISEKLASAKARVETTKQYILQSKIEVENAKKRKREYQKRKKDLAKWFWVPGYNYYLIGRSLDDVINKIPQIEKKIKREEVEKNNLENKCNSIKKDKDKLLQDLENIDKQMLEIEESERKIINQENLISYELVHFNQVNIFLKNFKVEVTSLEDKNRTVQTFLELLNNDKKVIDEMGELYISYKEAFIETAKIMDKYIFEIPIKIPGKK
jgi:hypothetical protein